MSISRAAAFALLPVLLGAGAIAATLNSGSGEARPAISAAEWQPRVGDVILTAADDLLGSRIAAASGDDAVYSHIGLVVEHDGRLAVVEASPFGAGQVAYADLAAFTTDAKTSELLILRADRTLDAARINADAARLVAGAVPFDFAMDMGDGSRLYCAELVYNLLGSAGLDLRGIEWVDAYVPFSGNQRLVTPDAFARTPVLRPVYRRST